MGAKMERRGAMLSELDYTKAQLAFFYIIVLLESPRLYRFSHYLIAFMQTTSLTEVIISLSVTCIAVT